MPKTVQQQDSAAKLLSLMRSWHVRRVAASLFFALPSLAAATVDSVNGESVSGEVIPAKNGIAITVAPGNWGAADIRDIKRVLESVAEEFRLQVGYPAEARLNIRVVPRGVSPRVLYERGPTGEYVVHLTARNERWFQYAYQFSHELCHIFSNFDHKELKNDEAVTSNQWFEESLCETASLFTLKRLAQTWADAPPARKWVGYAPTFAAYADYLLTAEHRHLPASQSLDQWYRENQAPLQESPYQREKNELAATALLPLFEKAPGNWRAIIYLNHEKANATQTFDDYLAAWYAACPLEQKELVHQTMALFGISPAASKKMEQVSLLHPDTEGKILQ